MFNALIVDDEIAARETIEALVDWEKICFEQPKLAKNGKEALSFFENENFDIIITDIQMPLMTGIELIEKIKEIKPDQKFIIISCHESFEYAKKAIKLGVTDYIIKDLATKEELNTLLLNMTNNINNKNLFVLKDKSQSGIDEKLRYSISASESRFYKEISDAIGFHLTHSLVGFSLRLSREGDSLQWASCIEDFSKLVSKNFPASFMTYDNRLFILSSSQSNFSMLYFINSVLEQINMIRYMAQKCGIKAVSIGVSKYSKSIEDIPILYKQATQAVEMRMLMGLNKNIFYDAIRGKSEIFDVSSVETNLKNIKKLLYSSDKNLGEELSKIFKAEFDMGFAKINYYKYINDSLFGLLQGFIDNKQIDRKSLDDRGCNLSSSYINSLETIEQMRDYFTKLFSEILNCKLKKKQSISSIAKEKIMQNIENKISLNEIADMMHHHKAYLSRVFKEETGENIVQYIVNLKLERAKSLLENTHIKPSDISNMLGFTTPQYFSVVFKKYTGKTPSEFRKKP